MMKKILLLFGLLFLGASSNAQNYFSFSPDSLNFGSFSPGIADTKMVVVSYNGPDTAISFKPYAPAVYGSYHPYTVLNDLNFSGTGTSDTMWVAFASNQNLNYDTYIILSNRFLGAQAYRVKGRVLFPKTYYGSTFDLREEALKAELTDIISSATNLGYNTARDRMFMNIDNWKVNGRVSSVNKLEGVYTALVASNYANRTAAQNMGFNTEHSYPQSMFSSNEPMKSDLHHLYPADGPANSSRGNLPFGMAPSGAAVGSAGSKRSSTAFEPRDFVKGRIARSMMYFQLRHGNLGDFFRPMETLMRDWHDQFPVDAIEEKRNNDIDTYQGNRSPMVDYPQFSARIKSLVADSWNDSTYRVSMFPIDTLEIVDQGQDIVVMNEGDTSIQIIGFIEPDPQLSPLMISAGVVTPIIIAPKEAVHISLTVLQTGASGRYGDFGIEFSSGEVKTLIVDGFNASVIESVEEVGGSVLSTWPNPVSNELHIGLERTRSYDIKNPEGQLVLQGFTDSSIDVSKLESGIYFLSLPELKQQIRFVKI